eukprot:3680627-Amphidinium_carterae.1
MTLLSSRGSARCAMLKSNDVQQVHGFFCKPVEGKRATGKPLCYSGNLYSSLVNFRQPQFVLSCNTINTHLNMDIANVGGKLTTVCLYHNGSSSD